MKAIYSFFWDCGRQGYVQSLFVADQSDVAKAIGKQVYFGEILGKHSEVYGFLEKKDLTVKSEDQEFIRQFENIFGQGFSTGYNPLDYLSEDDDDETEEGEDD